MVIALKIIATVLQAIMMLVFIAGLVSAKQARSTKVASYVFLTAGVLAIFAMWI